MRELGTTIVGKGAGIAPEFSKTALEETADITLGVGGVALGEAGRRKLGKNAAGSPQVCGVVISDDVGPILHDAVSVEKAGRPERGKTVVEEVGIAREFGINVVEEANTTREFRKAMLEEAGITLEFGDTAVEEAGITHEFGKSVVEKAGAVDLGRTVVEDACIELEPGKTIVEEEEAGFILSSPVRAEGLTS